MKRIGQTLLRLLFLEPLALKLALMVTLLFTAIPLVHAVLGGYVKLFLVWGALVWLTNRLARRRVSRSVWLLGLFALAYGVTLWLNRATTPLSANLSGLAYMLLFFFVLFPCEADTARAGQEVRLLLGVFCGVTCLFTVACLVTFVLQIQYKTTVRIAADYLTPVIIGMSDNRLHGLYNCNTGSTLNLLSSAFSLLLLTEGTGRAGKVFHGVNLVLQYVCLLLTLSRAAWYMYVVFAFLYVLFLLPWRWSALSRGMLAVGVALLVVGLSVPVKAVMSYVPAAVESLATEPAGDTPASTEEDDRVDISRLEDTDEVGVFTGRTELWYGGWRAFQAKPFFGTSREGLYAAAAPYVAERWLPNLHRGGLHNMPLTVLVCSGGVGFALLLAFLLVTGTRAVRGWRGMPPLARGLLLLLVCLLGVELMEARLLYSATIFGFVFWTVYGYALRLGECDG